jgi:protein TonB
MGHAGLGAAALLNWQPTPPELPPAGVVVELATLTVAPSAPPTEVPPGPKQVQVEPPPEPEAEPIVEKIEPPPEPDVQPVVFLPPPPKKKPEPKKEVKEIEPQPPLPPIPVTTAPPAVAAPPAPKYDAPVESAAAVSSTVMPTFQQRLAAHLQRHKQYPRVAQRRRQQGVVQLQFVMDAAGKVLSYRLDKRSGYAALDEEVESLIQRAQPLPPIPPELGKATLEVVQPLDFFLR